MMLAHEQGIGRVYAHEKAYSASVLSRLKPMGRAMEDSLFALDVLNFAGGEFAAASVLALEWTAAASLAAARSLPHL